MPIFNGLRCVLSLDKETEYLDIDIKFQTIIQTYVGFNNNLNKVKFELIFIYLSFVNN